MNSDIEKKFQSYPDDIREKLVFLRQLIIETATESNKINSLEESLKWGEPGYSVKGGSTIRIDWKSSAPKQYSMYFHCKTKLVDTFKEIYPDTFCYEGNRAINFQIDEAIPVKQLKHCISLSLNYHKIKHLPLLGA